MATIITRAEWGAIHEDGFGSAPLPAREVWLHHSVTIAPNLVPPWDDDDAAIRTLEQIGEGKFGRGISYTFAVTPVGRVYEGHRIDGVGAHTAKRNTIARGIVLVGNYDTARPSDAQLDAVAWLLRHGQVNGWWPQARLAGGHRDAPGANTLCPGRHGHAAIADIHRRAAAGIVTGGDHVVVRGDTLWSIASRYGVTVAQVQHLSGLTSNVIHPGQRLRIPGGAPPPPIAPPPAGQVLRRGMLDSPQVRALQTRLNRDYPSYSKLLVDGDYGPSTERVVREFQRRAGLLPDGIAGPVTLRRLGL